MEIAREPGEEKQRSLRGLDEAFPGCEVLGVRQRDHYVGARPADVELHEGDRLIVYGPRERVNAPFSNRDA